MKKLAPLCILLAVTTLVAEESKKPNFILIMGEAQGWASLSTPLDDTRTAGSASRFILTPNLDSIARSGIRFSDFYASAPRCTPTRAAFFTGISPAALKMTFVNEGKKEGNVSPGDKVIPPDCTTELPVTVETIADLLKKQGYATAHFGKWHVGRNSPKEHGFDENDGANSNGGPDNVEDPNPKQCHEIVRQGIDFIEREAQAGKPFYLQLSEYPGRGIQTASPETFLSVRNRLGSSADAYQVNLAAGDEEIDRTIGEVIAKVRDLGLEKNTYIIYTADHGAQGRNANGILTNGKGSVSEGGVRVPLLVQGPGIKPGIFSHVRASMVDLFPTIAELAGISPGVLPRGLEGGSLAGVMRGDGKAAVQRPRDELVIHFPHYDKDEMGPASAILNGNYKLIRIYESGERRLFDLSTDISEQHDIASANPEIVASMDKKLSDYLLAVNAGLPSPNPNYDPAGARSGDRHGMKGAGNGGGGGGKKSHPWKQPTPSATP